MAVCSMLCTDGLLLHLVRKRQLLVVQYLLFLLEPWNLLVPFSGGPGIYGFSCDFGLGKAFLSGHRF